MILIALGGLYSWFGQRASIGPAIPAQPGAASGKHVLLITLDTVRADRLGCYGCNDVQTPVIDALAANGIRFSDAITAAPITLPSHATMMTGLYPPRHGVRDNGKFKLGEKRTSLAERLKEHGYATGAFIGAFVLDKRYGLDQGFDVYDDEMAASRRFSGMRSGAPQRPGDVVTDAALDWLKAHHDQAVDVPFFAWVHLFDAHTPYSPPEPFATKYRDDPYLGEIAFVDKQVGRLVDFLRERSLLEDTLIIIAGDHGEGLGEHDEDTHSLLIYETTIAVPLIWNCPTLLPEPRVVSDRVVSLADIAPTALDLLGLEIPPHLDGLSLLDRNPPAHRAVYTETLAPQLNHGWSPLFGLRRLRDKYIEAPTPEYYDLATDRKELTNLFSASHKQARSLEKSIADLRQAIETEATDSDNVVQDNEALQKLAALGYVASSIGDSEASPADPKDMIPFLRKMSQAIADFNAGRFAESIALYREILERSPDDVSAWSGLSLALFSQGSIDEAIKAILNATRLQPEERHWIQLARFQMHKGDDEACLASLEQAESVVPADGDIPLMYGERLLRLKQYEEAIQCFETAREIDPSRVSVSAYVLTGRASVELGKLAEARSAYDQALYCDPNDLRALDELASLDERNQDFEAALPSRQRLCALRPDAMQYANKLSALYFKLVRPEDAISTLETLAARQPGNAAALGNLANALATHGDLERAINTYKKALELQPAYAIARYNLAGALEQRGDLEAAIAECRTVIEQRPDFAPARNRLLVLLVESGQLDEAFSELKEAALLGLVDLDELAADARLEAIVNDPRFKTLSEQKTDRP